MDRLLGLVLVLLVSVRPVWGQHGIEAARELVAGLVETQGVPGAQVAVWRDGEIVWSEGFGLANVELGAPVTTETKFRIASISKSITGTVLAKLAVEGRIDLDAPVGTYIADAPEAWATLTARHAASHTAGIRHYRGNEIGSLTVYPSAMLALSIFASDPLLFEPGAKYDYSTYGFTLLGATMEAATGEEFFSLLREELLEPAGMDDTVVDERLAIIENRATAYEFRGEGEQREVVNARPTDHSYKIAGGGLLSTAEDLVRLGAVVMEPGLLDEDTLELIWTPLRLADGTELRYSLGWVVLRDGDGTPQRLSHTGGQPGATSVLVVSPREGMAVAIVSNVRGARIGVRLAERIAEQFAGAE